MGEDKRCTKTDKGGAGCVKAAGHNGRCKVRRDAAALFAAGDDVGGPGRAGGRRKKAADLSAEMGSLSELAGEIETECNGLIGDCRAAVDRVRAIAAAVNERNRLLLRSLVKSRRDLAALADVQSGDGDESTP